MAVRQPVPSMDRNGAPGLPGARRRPDDPGRSWKLLLTLLLISMMVFTAPGGLHYAMAVEPVAAESEIMVYFSPEGGATTSIVKEITSAKKEVLVQAYTLTSQPIVKALLDARARGVDVRLILDKSERVEGMAPGAVLANAGAVVFLDGVHALMHTNIIILDRRTVVTGSFSFTKAAEEMNAEDVLIIRSPGLAAQYRDSWEKHRAHSLQY